MLNPLNKAIQAVVLNKGAGTSLIEALHNKTNALVKYYNTASRLDRSTVTFDESQLVYILRKSCKNLIMLPSEHWTVFLDKRACAVFQLLNTTN